MKKTRILLAAALLLAVSTDRVDALVASTFTDVNEKVLASDTTSFVSLPAEPFEITNDTGVEWIDFHVTLLGLSDLGLDYPFMRFVDLGDPGIYVGPGLATFEDANLDPLGYDDRLDITGITVPDGGVLTFSVDIFGGVAPEGLGSYQILGVPSFIGAEPGTLLLLGTGIAGFGLLRGRRESR